MTKEKQNHKPEENPTRLKNKKVNFSFLPSGSPSGETLSDKIWTPNNKSKTFIELYNLEIILKQAIKRMKIEAKKRINNVERSTRSHCVGNRAKGVTVRFLNEFMEEIDKIFGDKLI